MDVLKKIFKAIRDMFGFFFQNGNNKILIDKDYTLKTTPSVVAKTVSSHSFMPDTEMKGSDVTDIVIGRVTSSTKLYTAAFLDYSGELLHLFCKPKYAESGTYVAGILSYSKQAEQPSNAFGIQLYDEYGNVVFNQDTTFIQVKKRSIVYPDNSRVVLEDYPEVTGDLYYVMSAAKSGGLKYVTSSSLNEGKVYLPFLTSTGFQWDLWDDEAESGSGTYSFDLRRPFEEIQIAVMT